jgi:lipopolysaccharide/colanic/teichoic acid biosynthesis glycosyltransferase
VVLAALVLVLTAPLMLLVALVVGSTMGRPVFFRQTRPGRDEKPFMVLKFRTMTAERSGNGEMLPDEERITSVGRFLRKTSIDELPQLWNVLKGDMSLVGPRPLLLEYIDRYTADEARRHSMRPGLTGLAQIAGRNFVPWDERLALDVRYVDNWSLRLDQKILAKTLWHVVSLRNSDAAGHTAMPPLREPPQ